MNYNYSADLFKDLRYYVEYYEEHQACSDIWSHKTLIHELELQDVIITCVEPVLTNAQKIDIGMMSKRPGSR